MPTRHDQLEITVKQAPIYKVVITNNSIDIVKGCKKPIIEQSFKITAPDINDKLLSLPLFLNQIIEDESKQISYCLDGYHTINEFPVVNRDTYDNYTGEEYYARGFNTFSSDLKLLFLDKIDFYGRYIYIASKTENMHKLYHLAILKNYNYGQMNPYAEVLLNPNDVNINEFSIEFLKTDCLYVSNKGNIKDYSNERANQFFDNFIKNKNSIVGTNDDLGFIVTKENQK